MASDDTHEPRPVPTPARRLAARRSRPRADRQDGHRVMPGVLFPVMEDLSLISADDELLDSIASGQTDFRDLFAGSPPLSAGFAGPPSYSGGPIGPLLATWRSTVVDPPLPVLPELSVPKRSMTGPPASPRRSARPVLAAAVAICALLMGSAVAGAHSASPGDALWPLTQVLYAEHADSVLASNNINKALDSAESMYLHDPAEAVRLLQSAQQQIGSVAASDGKGGLQARLDSLMTLVRQSTGASADALPGQPVLVPPTAGTSGTATVTSGSTTGSTSTSGTATTSTSPTTTTPSSPGGRPTTSSPNAPIGPPPLTSETGPGIYPIGPGTTDPGNTDPVTTTSGSTSTGITTAPSTSNPSLPVTTDPGTSATSDPTTSVSSDPTTSVSSDPITTVSTDPTTSDPGSSTDPATSDPGTSTDPGTSDPGTSPDPGTTDPLTSDPGTTSVPTSDPGTSDPGTSSSDPGTSSDSSTTSMIPSSLPVGTTD